MNKNYLFIILLSVNLFINIHQVKSQIASFEDLNLPPGSFWNGENNSGGFTNGGFFFENNYSDFGGGMYSWYGFAYSNMTDTLTSGYSNQFSAITGKGALNSANYAVSYVNYDWMNNYSMHPNGMRFIVPQDISGFYATNNTYAYFSMLNGDGTLAKKFGGSTGNDPDWLKLQIKGYRNGNLTDTVNCFLADFRFADNTEDYILKTWEWVDLSVLGIVDSLTFGLTSSDNGAYGMNTPAYFCMDNFNGVNPNVGINNLKYSDVQISMYPNPLIEKLHISIQNSKTEMNVNIIDGTGKEIIKMNNVNHELTINLAELPAGIYFVNVSGGNHKFCQKILKK